MRRKKYNQSGVWACPYCWKAASKEAVENMYYEAQRLKVKKIEPTFYCCGTVGPKWIYFDSQAEYVYAQKLKEMESRGLLTELKHHPRIEIIPEIFYYPGRDIFAGSLDNLDYDPFLNDRIQVLKPEMYEADFSFIKNGKTHYVEVKSVDRYNQPFIPNLSKFRQKMERIKAIHGIEVEIWTGNARWRFVGKKLEAIK